MNAAVLVFGDVHASLHRPGMDGYAMAIDIDSRRREVGRLVAALRLVVAALAHCGLRIVGDDDFGDAAKELKGVHTACDPVLESHGGERFYIQVVAGRQGCSEDTRVY